MKNFIIVAIVLIIIGAAIAYIVKAKRAGVKCVGCPSSGTCAGSQNKSSKCSCGCEGESESNCGCHADTK